MMVDDRELHLQYSSHYEKWEWSGFGISKDGLAGRMFDTLDEAIDAALEVRSSKDIRCGGTVEQYVRTLVKRNLEKR